MDAIMHANDCVNKKQFTYTRKGVNNKYCYSLRGGGGGGNGKKTKGVKIKKNK